ncbi:hypothetical protein AB0G60_08655 [Streptomyces angustmyceticus]|uniref:Uncharacterized protein n=1 Tax=Streptomyces angustmyceticus TaxID=285578 RepID=A0A5J4LEC0_9ACTN|nr:hypothetical protein [Streptomyces angustmyceticus]GES30864.1 hypothetical protein San01_33510 [Streptomyces angustmyceticus]
MNGPGTDTGRAGGGPDGGTGPGGAGRPVEDRLRRALAARAESIAVRDLRPAAPPGPHLRRTRLPGVRHLWPRRFGLPLAAAAAAAAVAIGYAATAPGTPPDRRPAPATPPRPVVPAPSPHRTDPGPAPSPSAPSDGPHRTARPTGSVTPGAPSAPPSHTPGAGSPTPRPTDRPSGAPPSTTLPPAGTPSADPTGARSAPGGRGSTPSPSGG